MVGSRCWMLCSVFCHLCSFLSSVGFHLCGFLGSMDFCLGSVSVHLCGFLGSMDFCLGSVGFHLCGFLGSMGFCLSSVLICLCLSVGYRIGGMVGSWCWCWMLCSVFCHFCSFLSSVGFCLGGVLICLCLGVGYRISGMVGSWCWMLCSVFFHLCSFLSSMGCCLGSVLLCLSLLVSSGVSSLLLIFMIRFIVTIERKFVESSLYLRLLLSRFLLLLRLNFLFFWFSRLALHLLFLAQMVALWLISANAVVGLVVGGNGGRSLEVLEQVLVLMSLELAANFHTMNTLAGLVLLNSLGSFHFRLGPIMLVQTLEFHATKTLQEVKVVR